MFRFCKVIYLIVDIELHPSLGNNDEMAIDRFFEEELPF
jgi:hypothetical protein